VPQEARLFSSSSSSLFRVFSQVSRGNPATMDQERAHVTQLNTVISLVDQTHRSMDKEDCVARGPRNQNKLDSGLMIHIVRIKLGISDMTQDRHEAALDRVKRVFEKRHIPCTYFLCTLIRSNPPQDFGVEFARNLRDLRSQPIISLRRDLSLHLK